jgi:Ca2+-binding RTX toxin-like protein
MFHSWMDSDPRRKLEIKFVPGTLGSTINKGKVTFDPEVLNNASYINPFGTAVKDTFLTAFIHELGHALTENDDNYTEEDYKGDNVKYVNQIYNELGLPEQISYIAYDEDGTFLKLNYKYTNGAEIDAARITNENISSARLGASSDLLIGGLSANILQSSKGDDFLFGAGGDDELNGGTGKDTGVYFGTPLDYDIRKNSDDSWSVRNVRGAKNAGSDTLKNVDVVQFDNGQTYDLIKAGLTFQTDIAFVIDTTGSMTRSIGGVKAKASKIIDKIFADDKDARIGVVGFQDNTLPGEASRVILPFTDQDDFEDRKSVAVAAINGITVDGGGDRPETSFDGLRLALDGSMGQWRFGAGTLRVVLFTDAEAKDGFLEAQVNALASSIGAGIERVSRLGGSGGSVDTFSLTFGGDESGGSVDTFSPAFGGDESGDSVDTFSSAFKGDGSSSAQRGPLNDFNANPPFPFVPSDDPIPPDPTTAQLQIFTIFTGPSDIDTSDFESIADTTGGRFFRTTTGDDVVDTLLDIINLPSEPVGGEVGVNLDGTDGPDELTGTPLNDRLNGSNGEDTLTGLAGNDMLSGDNDDDILNGGPGVDQLTGGLGSNILTGGKEADTFVFAERGNSLMDNITDLVIGTDIIDGFSAVTATNIAKVGEVSFLTRRGIAAKLTESTFGANGAAIFTLKPTELERTTEGETTEGEITNPRTSLLLNDHDFILEPADIWTTTERVKAETRTFLALNDRDFILEPADIWTTPEMARRETRTFLALNDRDAGFSLNKDIIIEITGYSGDLNNLAIV